MKYAWINVNVPSSYSIRNDVYRCRVCGTIFDAFFSNGNELVKFIEDNGTEVRWLPTFEAGGYLDLVEKLVPGYKKTQSINMSISRRFEAAFKTIQEHSNAGNTFSLAVGSRCPSCNSDNKELLSEKILESPTLAWLRYSKLA